MRHHYLDTQVDNTTNECVVNTMSAFNTALDLNLTTCESDNGVLTATGLKMKNTTAAKEFVRGSFFWR
jgi:hypothetical protein